MDFCTTHRFNSHKGVQLFFCCIVFAVCVSGCSLQGNSQQPTWEDFCAETEQTFSENSSPLTPNYVDSDGWCYFLAEDSRQIYRFSQEDPQPKVVIEDAWKCMTVIEAGVLFLRGHERYVGSHLWAVHYDLVLWQDGVETVLWKNSDIDPRDGNVVTVGNYLIYYRKSKIHIRPLILEDTVPSVGACIGDIPDIYHTQDFIWCDGETLWYGERNHTQAISALRALTLRTEVYTNYETSDWSSAGWDRRQPWPIGAQNGQLYFVQDGRLYMQDLKNLTVQELRDLQAYECANVYGTSTGEAMVFAKVPQQSRYITQNIAAGWTLESTDRIMVQTVFGDMAVVKCREYIDGYDYYPRTALYRLNTNAKAWESSGELYVEAS